MSLPEVVASGVTIAGPHGPLVADLDLDTGHHSRVSVVGVDPGPGQVALALAIAGRVRLAAGRITINGWTDAAHLQSIVRVIDAENVSAPDGSLSVRTVVAEELALAGQTSRRWHVRAILAAHDLTDRAADRWDLLPAPVRAALLLDLAAMDPDKSVLVLTGPDRHGGEIADWLAPARRAAAKRTVIAICSPTTAATATATDAFRTDAFRTDAPLTNALSGARS